MEATGIREAIPIEPRVVLTLIKEGTPPAPITEKQKAYENARDVVFTPQLELTKDRDELLHPPLRYRWSIN